MLCDLICICAWSFEFEVICQKEDVEGRVDCLESLRRRASVSLYVLCC